MAFEWDPRAIPDLEECPEAFKQASASWDATIAEMRKVAEKVNAGNFTKVVDNIAKIVENAKQMFSDAIGKPEDTIPGKGTIHAAINKCREIDKVMGGTN